MPMMRVGRCRAILFFCSCLNYIDGFNGRSSEYVFDTDVHGGSWQGSGTPILSPSKEADAVSFRSRGIVLQVDPSPRLRLGTFNGRRPSRESLIGNGAGAPPVSRFLYRPHCRRIKSESQEYLSLGSDSMCQTESLPVFGGL